MAEPLRKHQQQTAPNRAKSILPKPSAFEFVLARSGAPKIATILAALKSEFTTCALGERLGDESPHRYAAVHALELDGQPLVLKVATPREEIPFETAVDLLNHDKVALSARLSSMPHYRGALRDRDGFLVAVLATFVPGVALPQALKSGAIALEEAKSKLVQTLSGFFAQKFNLVDPDPTNFIVTPSNEVVLVDGGALSRREVLIERWGTVEAAELQLVNSPFFEERGETIRRPNLREIADLVLRGSEQGAPT